MLAAIEVPAALRSDRAGEPRALAAPTVANDPLGPLPLWGYRGSSD
jgi:hypothetical protein